ncbi:MAG: histidinol-phosphatase HisJ family protein [Candidatus Edwardsbacteria bacterium]|nr:histidinol-phosphatase HisJ family protein [Candidatus Edwardsbacteria bacterium]
MNPEILKYQIGAIDTHLHSRHSCDSKMEPAAACRRAMELGLKALVFTEHVDFDPSDQGYGVYNDKAVESSLADCRVLSGKHLKIYKGVEITYQPQYRDQIEKFINSHKFDFVMGSVHMVGLDDVSWPELAQKYFGRMEEEQAYGAYFQEVLKLVDSRLFDCLGHLDLCKKYGFKHYGAMSWQKYQRPIKKILERAVQRDLMVEINTSGLRHDPQETYPGLPAVMEYLKMGGTRLTLGSDAHQAEHIAHGFTDILTKIPELKGLNKK